MSFTLLPTPQSIELQDEAVSLGQSAAVELEDGAPAHLRERVMGLLQASQGARI